MNNSLKLNRKLCTTCHWRPEWVSKALKYWCFWSKHQKKLHLSIWITWGCPQSFWDILGPERPHHLWWCSEWINSNTGLLPVHNWSNAMDKNGRLQIIIYSVFILSLHFLNLSKHFVFFSCSQFNDSNINQIDTKKTDGECEIWTGIGRLTYPLVLEHLPLFFLWYNQSTKTF